MTSSSFSTSLLEVIIGNESLEIIPGPVNSYFLYAPTELIKLLIGNSIKYLEKFLYAATNLPYLEIPANVKELRSNALNTVGVNIGTNLIFKGAINIKSGALAYCNVNELILPAGSKLECGSLGSYIKLLTFKDDVDKILLGNSLSCILSNISILKFDGGSRIKTNYGGNTSVKAIEIGPSIKRIESSAFSYFNGLNSLYIPKTVDYIGKGSFQYSNPSSSYSSKYPIVYIGAKKLDEDSFRSLNCAFIKIDSEIIGPSAFRNGLFDNIQFSENLKEIGEQAFQEIQISSNVTLNIYNCKTIKKRAFYYGGSSNYYLNLENVEIVEDEAFYIGYSGKGLLGNCYLKNAKYVGYYAFGYSGISTVVFGDNISEIGNYAFTGCTNLNKVVFSNTIKVIPESCFSGCSRLTTLDLTNSITTIDKYSLPSSNISTINVSKNSNLVLINDDLRSSPWCVNILQYNQVVTLGKVIIKDNRPITNDILNLLDENIKGIGSACYMNKYLKKVSIPYITHIAYMAFDNDSIESIEFSEDLEYIGLYAFRGHGLINLFIPSKVSFIGESAFKPSLNNKLETIVVDSNNITYDSRNNCNALIETKTNKLILGSKNTNIPNTIINIGKEAFNSTPITSVKIPSSVTEIESRAFYNCTSLTQVNILNLESWLKISFNNTESNPLKYAHHLYINEEEVTELNIPSTITTIKRYAFVGCLDLTYVYIPNWITSIETNAFSACGNLTTIEIDSNILTSISSYTSASNNFVEKFNNYITKYIFTNNIQTIGKYICYDSSNLEIIEIGTGITSIGTYAFSSCPKLKTITIKATTPPTLGASAFNTSITGRKIYVPAESVDTYKAASGWSTYADDIEAIPTE